MWFYDPKWPHNFRNEMTKTEWLKTILTEPRFTEWFFYRIWYIIYAACILRAISNSRIIKKFLCEILFWFNPQKSLAYLSLFNIFIHLIYFFTKNGIIYVTAYFLLFRLWKPIWTERIWVSHHPGIHWPLCLVQLFVSTEGPPRCRPLGLNKNQTAYFRF